MVDVIGRAKVIVSGDVDSTSIDQTSGKIGAGLKRAAVVGGAALGTLAVAGVKVYQSFEQAEAQSRKLNTVLDNMGKGEAAPAVENLADELMRLTAVDDEVIKSGQTVLATFDSVNDSAGELGGTFERATRLSVDMASVFGSVDSASRILGKALEDPEKAAARLVRSNVILSDAQKQLIEDFVAAGDQAAAQDVILSALEERYAGTAEAAKTQSDSIKTAFGELEEAAGHLIAELGGGEGEGGGLSGAIYGVADALNETAESEEWGHLGEELRGTSGDVKDLATGLFDLDQKIGKAILSIPGFGDALLGVAAPITSTIGVLSKLIGKIQDAYTWFKRLDGVSGDDVPDAPDVSQPASTRAVGGPASGLTVVGERGWELLDLPNGSYVHSNANSQGIAAAAASGGDTFNITHIGNADGLVQKLNWQSRYRRVGA